MREIPKLTDAVVRADVKGNPSYDVTTTGAADAVREPARPPRRRRARPRAAPSAPRARPARFRASPGPRARSRAPSRPRATWRSRATTRSPPRRSPASSPELSQIDLAKIDAYERKNQNRTTVLSRITSLRGDEPWAGYDELTAAEVQAVLSEGDDDRAKQVRSYERAHKNRAGVLKAAERELTNA